jgi:hypothetical protein
MEVDRSLAEMAILVTSTGFRCLGMSWNADTTTGVAVDMVTSSRTSPLQQAVERLVGDLVLATFSAARVTRSGKQAEIPGCAAIQVAGATGGLVGAGVGGEGADEDVAGAVVSSLPEVVKINVVAPAAGGGEVAGEGARRGRQS